MPDYLKKVDGDYLLLQDGSKIILQGSGVPVDFLTKLIFHSNYPAFKNDAVYTGSFSLSGTTASGINDITETVPLDSAPDLLDVVFQGNSDATFDIRPDDAWFKKGRVWVRGDGGAITNLPLPWDIGYYIDGSNLVIRARYVQTFTQALTMTAETVQYKVVDYSVF